MTSESRIEAIKSKLDILREFDNAHNIFGASKHKYNSIKIEENDLAKFETEIGVDLPNNFRQFLKLVGHGAGPDYGIYSLEDMVKEFDNWNECLDGKGEYNNDIDLANTSKLSTVNGILPFMSKGCTSFAFIVLTGNQRGTVWGVDTNEFAIFPLSNKQELDFLTWYELWLKRSLPGKFATKLNSIFDIWNIKKKAKNKVK